MSTHLTADFSTPPVQNLDYFIPLNLKIDASEKENFINNGLKLYKDRFKGTGKSLMPVEFNNSLWTNTLKEANEFFAPIHVSVRCSTIFVSDANTTCPNIHKDGAIDSNGNPTLLEARLAYYEIADAPGIIRWWNDTIPMTLLHEQGNPTLGTPPKVICRADCAHDLANGKVTWDNLPAPDFTAVTTCSSAIVRTNKPHHVIQGNGFRATIGFQLVTKNDTIAGVWKHIQENIHRLGV